MNDYRYPGASGPAGHGPLTDAEYAQVAEALEERAFRRKVWAFLICFVIAFWVAVGALAYQVFA